MARRKTQSRAKSASSSRGKRGGRTSAQTRSTSGRRASSGSSAGKSSGRSARSRSSARNALQLLKNDHREVAGLLQQFERAQEDRKRSLAEQICRMLTVHAQIEEELLYPQAHEALGEDGYLIAEARVEHASLKDLIAQIEGAQEGEEFEARVQVLSEYVKHHVKEEETEVFPRLTRTDLDLEALGDQLAERKQELTGSESGGSGEDGEGEEMDTQAPPRQRSGRGQRPSL